MGKHNIIDTDQTTVIIEKMQGSSQSPGEVFMIRPAHFMFNAETAVTNHFQDDASKVEEEKSVQQAALDEFDAAVETLKSNNVRVTVFQDTVYHVKLMPSSPTTGSVSTALGILSSTPWPHPAGGWRGGWT